MDQFPRSSPNPPEVEAYRESAKADPNAIAEVRQISQRLNSSPSAVESDIETARHAFKAPDWAKMRAGAPVVSKMSADPR